MSLRINYNLASSVAQRSLAASQATYAREAERLATGRRINRASDDGAGMAVSERLKNQVRGLTVAHRNAQDGISLVRTAEGAMGEAHALLARMRELAVQAANDTINNTDRLNIKAGESVVVLGQGTTGLLHTRLAVLAGATVIAISRTKWKLDMATRLGAKHALDISAEKAVDEILRLTGGSGADVVIDNNGTTEAMLAQLRRHWQRVSGLNMP